MVLPFNQIYSRELASLILKSFLIQKKIIPQPNLPSKNWLLATVLQFIRKSIENCIKAQPEIEDKDVATEGG